MLVQNVQTDPRSLSGIFSVFKGKNVMPGDVFSNLFNSMTGNVTQNVKADVESADINRQDAVTVSTDAKIGGSVSEKTVSERETGNSTDIGNNTADRKVNGKGNAKTAEEDEITEEDIAKVSVCFSQITGVVAQFFGIDEEQLQGFLETAGISMTDLGNLQKLQELFVNVNCNGDVTELLTDGGLLKACEELLDSVSDILSEAGIENDDFASILEMFTKENGTVEISLSNEVKESSGETAEENLTAKLSEEAYAGNSVNASSEMHGVEKTGAKENRDSKRDDFGARSDKNDEVIDFTDKFVDHMLQNLRTENVEFSALTNQTVSFRNITDQILTQIKVNLTEDISSLEIKLTPEHLGKVNVVVEDNNGIMTAKFQTESRISKEAIESNLPVFKQQLREQGFKVDSVEVTVAEYAFDKNKESGNGSGTEDKNRNRKHFSLEEINEKVNGHSSDLSERIYLDNGTSTVSYSA